jgi:hypothetical protein
MKRHLTSIPNKPKTKPVRKTQRIGESKDNCIHWKQAQERFQSHQYKEDIDNIKKKWAETSAAIKPTYILQENSEEEIDKTFWRLEIITP